MVISGRPPSWFLADGHLTRLGDGYGLAVIMSGSPMSAGAGSLTTMEDGPLFRPWGGVGFRLQEALSIGALVLWVGCKPRLMWRGFPLPPEKYTMATATMVPTVSISKTLTSPISRSRGLFIRMSISKI